MENTLRTSPVVSLAQTEGQEGKLVSTVPPCSGSSTSGQVSPCTWRSPSPTLQCVCRREKNRILSPLQYKRLPQCNTSGTKKGLCLPSIASRFKESTGQGSTPSEGVQWYIYRSYQYAASVSSETRVSSQSFVTKLESTNLTQPRNISINLNQGNLIRNYTEKTWHFQYNTHISCCLLYLVCISRQLFYANYKSARK